MNLHDVLVAQGFEYFCLNEDGVDVSHRTDVFSFYDFNRESLCSLLVLGQVNFSKPTLSQKIQHFILCEAAGGIELLSPRHIQHCTAFDKIQILLEILWSFWVVDAGVGRVEFESSADVSKRGFVFRDEERSGFLVGFPILIEVNLNKMVVTILGEFSALPWLSSGKSMNLIRSS